MEIPFSSGNNILTSSTVVDSSFQGSLQAIKFDSSMSVIWRDTIQNQALNFGEVSELPDGSVMICYLTNIIKKLNSSGIELWVKDFSDTSYHGFGNIESKSLFFIDSSSYFISSTIRWTGPGASAFYLTRIGDSAVTYIEETEAPGIYIYPNPAANYINLKGNFNADGFIKIYDMYGREVFSERFIGNKKILNTENFITGMYIVVLSSNNCRLSRRFIIDHFLKIK